jgi:mRNA-degrading endonuclease toxin of MazEF toxin-antitoxin module
MPWKSAANPVSYPRRGDVYLVGLDKARPAVILSVDELNKHALDVCIVPVTSVEHAAFSMRVPLRKGDGGLRQDCWAKCDQVTTIEKTFLQKPIGRLSAQALQKIELQVKVALGLLP